MVEKYQQSQAIIAANELRIIPLLEAGVNTIHEIAVESNLSERGVELLLKVLEDIKLVRSRVSKSSEIRFTPTKIALDCFGIHGKIKSWTAHQGTLFRLWTMLPASISSGKPQLQNTHDIDVKSYAQGLMEYYSIYQKKLHSVSKLKGKIRLLDIGGGLGHYSVLAALANPHLEATVYDRPEIISLAREFIRDFKLEERVSVIEGDVLKDTLPAGYNVILLSNILHGKSASETSRILSKAFYVLDRGKLIINEWINGTPKANLFHINMLICTNEGRVWTKKELSKLVRDAGFVNLTWKNLDFTNWILEAKKDAAKIH